MVLQYALSIPLLLILTQSEQLPPDPQLIAIREKAQRVLDWAEENEKLKRKNLRYKKREITAILAKDMKTITKIDKTEVFLIYPDLERENSTFEHLISRDGKKIESEPKENTGNHQYGDLDFNPTMLRKKFDFFPSDKPTKRFWDLGGETKTYLPAYPIDFKAKPDAERENYIDYIILKMEGTIYVDTLDRIWYTEVVLPKEVRAKIGFIPLPFFFVVFELEITAQQKNINGIMVWEKGTGIGRGKKFFMRREKITRFYEDYEFINP